MLRTRVIITALLIAAVLLLALIGKISQDRGLATTPEALLEEVAGLIPESFKKDPVLSPEERRRIEEKIRQDTIKLEKLPKYDRLTFLIGAPYVGSLLIPAAWEGKYQVAEEGRVFKMNYVTPNVSLPLLQIQLVNEAEWQGLKNDTQNHLLEDKNEFKFSYRIMSSSSQDKMYQEFLRMLPEILKTFKSIKP